jgi:anti-sigma regulatory factor (Ser/Thr protein kinase)
MVAGESKLALPASPTSAGVARAFVRRWCSDLDSADTRDAVALCVSELVTNALDHAAPPYELRVARGCGRLRVEVTDASTGLPFVRPFEPTDGRGRGIFLVEHVSTQWGVEPTRAGKTVWAEFATPEI